MDSNRCNIEEFRAGKSKRARSAEARIKRMLRHTWHPFFARFGRLTDTQIRAIEPMLAGESVLLSAPTATGKTEAVCAPAIERLLRSDDSAGTPGLLVVAPTRALCNDLERRLRPPVRRSGLRVDRKTGDSPRLSTSKPPHVLVTTPESLDSMLCRRTRFLRSVQTVVFDELHLLDGDARGDQLECLSHRLLKVAPDVQRCATSATVARARPMAEAYLGTDAIAVETEVGKRELDARFVHAPELFDVERAVRDIHAADPGHKVLVFVNRRADVEWLSGQLDDIGALAHHGSLGREHRLQVERRFLRAPSGVCVATMTLEVGVDIGDIDRVVLVEPPADVSSFRQRIGRANRRGARIRVTMLDRRAGQRRRFEHMVECVERGRLFGESAAFRPAVAAQQAVSLAFQNPARWIGPAALHARLAGSARGELSVEDCHDILENLQDEGWLYGDSYDRFNPDEQAKKSFKYGQMHSNIAADRSVEVVDETTRRTVGRVSARYLNDSDETLAIGGRRRSVSRVRDARVFVESREGGDVVDFDPNGAPRMTFAYCQDLARFSGIPANTLQLSREGPGRWRLTHYLGTLWAYVLAGVFEERGIQTSQVNPFSMILKRGPNSQQRSLNNTKRLRRDAERAVEEQSRRLVALLQPGPFHTFVPESLQARWLRRSIRLDDFVAHLSASSIRESG